MDIGAIIKAPLDDNDWIKKCALIGLMTLIPILGFLNLLGWQIEYTRTRLAGGKELPEANLSYMGAGFRAFLSMLPLVGVVIGLIVVVAVFGFVATQLGSVGSILMIPVTIAVVVAYFAIVVVSPLFLYRHIVHDDTMAGARVGWALGVLKANVGAVVMLWVALIVASIVGGIGSMVVIGFIITMPLGQAMMGAATAEFANVTNRA